MENKWLSSFKYILKNDSKKVKIIVAVGLIGIVLIFFSDIGFSDSGTENSSDEQSINYSEYTDELEDKLTAIISEMSGVGECSVMITLENSTESVYATDSEEKTDDDSSDKKDSYVIYDSQNGEQPVLIKEYFPKVQGVSVVCSGGDDIAVKEKIIQTVTALFNISSNRVSVSKIKT
ncbi:MAG: hypothetical protein LIO62_08320 [Clostridiales bacterium]|nr:hypothetical protein [Clostridiales bacterium]